MNIAQVAKQFDLTASTLRYYESVGLIPPVNRKKVASAITMKMISNGSNL
jgi:DNA-binding transcriptional MerR regulator